MKKAKRIAGLVMIAVLVSATVEAQWVFIARKGMGMIRQMQSEHADVAAVILEASADKVYNKALATVEAKKNLKIIGKSDAEKTLAFTDGERKVKMKVSELSDTVSEILISATPAPDGQSTSSLVVERVLEVCKGVNVECRLAKK